MKDFKNTQDVINSTDSTTQKLINEILKIEKDNEHIQNLSPSTEKDISEMIIKLINQEIR